MNQPLRDYQEMLYAGITSAWYEQNARNVVAVMPTGAGKTKVVAHTVANYPAHAAVIAHRGEIVVQLSVALAREGVRHRVIGPQSLARSCTAAHMREFNRSYEDSSAPVAVASVDTLVRMDPKTPWFQQVGLWVQDECHHVLSDNKWGAAAKLFPHARGLGVTATPCRADGKGLGRHADGIMDAMVVGPSMRELINRDFLADYRIFAPPSDLDLSNVALSAGGDYSPPQLRAARHKSHITGDVVAHYLRLTPGKMGVTFDVDIESATETAAAFRAAGVPAEVISSKTNDDARRSMMQRLRTRELLQLVNVDLLGEGVDVPALEVVSMARPTQSYALFAQQFGRPLRPFEGKTGVIIDHVGNVMRHGLPDAPRVWTLDRRERRSRSAPTDVIPVRNCLNDSCMGVYERVLSACPYCGHSPPMPDRSSPERVDGDLFELDPDVLARMRGEARRIMDTPRFPSGATDAVVGKIRRDHLERLEAQSALCETVALWAGWQTHLGRGDAESYRRFFFRYGIDVLSAQALNRGDAEALTSRLLQELQHHGVTKK